MSRTCRESPVLQLTIAPPVELGGEYHVPFTGMMTTSSIHNWRNASMAKLASTVVLFALATTVASAQAPQNAPRQAGPPAQILSSVPANDMTVTHWYKQNVYDPSDSKIGEIMDVLMEKEGKVSALIIGVGGFIGSGEEDV